MNTVIARHERDAEELRCLQEYFQKEFSRKIWNESFMDAEGSLIDLVSWLMSTAYYYGKDPTDLIERGIARFVEENFGDSDDDDDVIIARVTLKKYSNIEFD